MCERRYWHLPSLLSSTLTSEAGLLRKPAVDYELQLSKYLSCTGSMEEHATRKGRADENHLANDELITRTSAQYARQHWGVSQANSSVRVQGGSESQLQLQLMLFICREKQNTNMLLQRSIRNVTSWQKYIWAGQVYYGLYERKLPDEKIFFINDPVGAWKPEQDL